MFVTAFLGYLDIRSSRFIYVNAGHNPPLIQKAGGEFMFLATKPSFILAGFENMTYREEVTTLFAGDILLLYTDGVTEAMNADLELFSNLRLLGIANTYRDCSVKD